MSQTDVHAWQKPNNVAIKSHVRHGSPEIMSISQIHVLLLFSAISLIVSPALPSRIRVVVLLNLKANSFIPKFKNYILQLPSQEKCVSEVVRIGGIIIFYLSKLWKAAFSILCDISGEAAGGICNWSFLGVKGFKA